MAGGYGAGSAAERIVVSGGFRRPRALSVASPPRVVEAARGGVWNHPAICHHCL
jgi:hypothetical protein